MLGGIVKGSSGWWHQGLKANVMTPSFVSFHFGITLDSQKVAKVVEWSLLLASPGGYILQNYSMMSNETTVDTGTSDKPHPRLHSLDGTPAMLQPTLSAIQANPRLGCCTPCTACSLFVYNVLSCFVFLETMRRPKRTAS